jgi:hypothetical protein
MENFGCVVAVTGRESGILWTIGRTITFDRFGVVQSVDLPTDWTRSDLRRDAVRVSYIPQEGDYLDTETFVTAIRWR